VHTIKLSIELFKIFFFPNHLFIHKHIKVIFSTLPNFKSKKTRLVRMHGSPTSIE